MNTLLIDNIVIRQDSEGRYCLNDLHRAAGGARKHQLSNWMRLDQTQELIAELVTQASEGSLAPSSTIHGGRFRGTYVVKELVYAYAMWISPAFQLKVIRAFDRLQTEGIAVADHAAEDLLKNPLAYYKKVLIQAKRLQAENEVMSKDLNQISMSSQ